MYYLICSLPNDETLAHVSQTKTNGLKKGLRKQQLLLSAKKKEYVSKHLTAPDDLHPGGGRRRCQAQKVSLLHVNNYASIRLRVL